MILYVQECSSHVLDMSAHVVENDLLAPERPLTYN